MISNSTFQPGRIDVDNLEDSSNRLPPQSGRHRKNGSSHNVAHRAVGIEY